MYGIELAHTSWEDARIDLVRHAAGQETPRHGHDLACLHAVLRGLYVEHSRAGTVVAGPGDVVSKGPEVEHWNRFAAAPAESLRLEPRWGSVLDVSCWEPCSPERLQAMVRIRRALRAGSTGPRGPTGSEGRLLHAATLARDITPQTRLLLRLRSRFREPLSLGALAEELGYHRSHLSRQFTRDFGCSPSAYVAMKRAAWVAQELARGSDSQAALAAAAGFADQSHCIRTFRRAFGSTPVRWSRAARW